MYNFFVTKEDVKSDLVYISNADYNHIKNVLRFEKGDEFLVSVDGASHLCQLLNYENQCVVAKILEFNFQNTSLPIKIHLFQGLPKSDKLELIIQKAVELGVEEITPVEMERCVVKLESKKIESKVNRWQGIAESAGKQSKRTSVPKVNAPISFKQLLNKMNDFDLFLIPYESAEKMQATKEALSKIKPKTSIGVLIGPEGGFSESEISLAKEKNTQIISLGKRILRTETASIATLSMLMLYAEMNLST